MNEATIKLFRQCSVDYSNFIPGSAIEAEFIADYIRQNIHQGIFLTLSTDKSSGVHLLSVGDNTQHILSFVSETDYQLHDIFYRGKQIIDIPHYNTRMYYLKETLKNIFFMEYLMCGGTYFEDNHSNFDSDEFLFKTFVASDLELDVSVIFNNESIRICNTKRNFEVEIAMVQYMYLFRLKENKITKKYITFNNFICNMNKHLYSVVVGKHLNIPSSDFTPEHRVLVNIFEI